MFRRVIPSKPDRADIKNDNNLLVHQKAQERNFCQPLDLHRIANQISGWHTVDCRRNQQCRLLQFLDRVDVVLNDGPHDIVFKAVCDCHNHVTIAGSDPLRLIASKRSKALLFSVLISSGAPRVLDSTLFVNKVY
jgi:hypothetical protein